MQSALRREIKEETDLGNIYIKKLLYAVSMKLNPEKQAVGLMYLCHALDDKVKVSDEHVNIIWANKEQMMGMVSDHMKNEIIENHVLDVFEMD